MRVKNLCFQHHKQSPYFFNNLSFELEEGLIHALHGKNGVGKSVLLHILSQNFEPDAVLTGKIDAEKTVLMCQQFDQTLVNQFTFLENLKFSSLPQFPSVFARLKSPTIPDYFLKLLHRFHIDVTIPVHKLSGGQRQILALLMKLQRNPRILLLDEPTATLDEQNATMVFEFLKILKGVTLLIVCHDQELINRYTTGQHLQMEIDTEGVRQLQNLSSIIRKR